jgi:hypothetical protein
MRGCAVSFVRGGCTLNLQWASMFDLALPEFRGMGMHSVVSGDLSGLQSTTSYAQSMCDAWHTLLEQYALQLQYEHGWLQVEAMHWARNLLCDESYEEHMRSLRVCTVIRRFRDGMDVGRFRDGCFAGRLEDAKRFVKEHGAPSVQWMQVIALRAAGMHGHLQILQWAVAELGVDLKDMFFLSGMQECRHLHVMQWAVENGVCMGIRHQRRCLEVACGRADGLGIVQWLCAQGGDPHGTPFENAVMTGRWHIAQWLVQREPEFPWPEHLLAQVMNRWSPNRVAWMRSVLFHS